MRVISNNQEEIEGTCQKCKAELGITRADIHIGIFRVYVVCPVCNTKLTISQDYYNLFGLHKRN